MGPERMVTMTTILEETSRLAARLAMTPPLARALLMVAIAAAVATGLAVVDPAASAKAVANAGNDLTRLLRGLAAIKAVMAACVAAGVWWRLGQTVGAPRLAAYALACGTMAAGPVLIWSMVQVGAGALLLHGGLLAGLLLLWRDPVVGARLASLVSARRAALRSR
jgi:hypothetical protein